MKCCCSHFSPKQTFPVVPDLIYQKTVLRGISSSVHDILNLVNIINDALEEVAKKHLVRCPKFEKTVECLKCKSEYVTRKWDLLKSKVLPSPHSISQKSPCLHPCLVVQLGATMVLYQMLWTPYLLSSSSSSMPSFTSHFTSLFEVALCTWDISITLPW